MESNDAPEKIAEFYKKALANMERFELLGCIAKTNARTRRISSGLSAETISRKRGSCSKRDEAKKHIVGIHAMGMEHFQLVYVEARGDDKEKKQTNGHFERCGSNASLDDGIVIEERQAIVTSDLKNFRGSE